eukprot:scaffold30763_cov30-Tisochrysis_lutea.AAC.6
MKVAQKAGSSQQWVRCVLSQPRGAAAQSDASRRYEAAVAARAVDCSLGSMRPRDELLLPRHMRLQRPEYAEMVRLSRRRRHPTLSGDGWFHRPCQRRHTRVKPRRRRPSCAATRALQQRGPLLPAVRGVVPTPLARLRAELATGRHARQEALRPPQLE